MAVSKIRMAWAVFVAIIVVAVGAALYYGIILKSSNSKAYQAVFLTSGQVYFGKIKNVTAATTTLEDIYYLQVQQPIQPAADQTKDQSKDQQQPQIQLVKLGNELHKPKDEMTIRNDQIVFTEEIQDDGQVGQAIARHKSGADQQPSQSQTPAQTPAPAASPATPAPKK